MPPKQTSGCKLGRCPRKHANLETVSGHATSSVLVHIYISHCGVTGWYSRFAVVAGKTRIEHCQKEEKKNTVSTLREAGRYAGFLKV